MTADVLPLTSDRIGTEVAAATQAFATGRTRPLSWRRDQLRALRAGIRRSAPRIHAAMAEDLGKNAVEANLTEITAVITEINHTLKNLKRWTADRKVKAPATTGLSSAYVRREPLGTVLIIGPWNYPFHLIFMPLIGALAAGNAVVLKPSELAPASSAVIGDIIDEYLDPSAVRVVQGGVPETTELLTHQFDHIFYTGNGTVAEIVMTAAARHLTPVTLELGGKSPVWVDDTVSLKETADSIAWGKFANCGQTCVAPDYVLTTEELVGPLAEAIAAAARRSFGDDPKSNPDYGRIINERHTERLGRLVGDGTAVIGGEVDPADRYVAPTVLVDVDADDPVMAEEIFGPILPIVTVADHREAASFISARPKPLALYAFTRDEQVLDGLLDGTSSGGVAVGSVMMQLGVPELPFGGVGASGMGAYHGEHSVATFSHHRGVLRRRGGPDPSRMVRPPFTAFKKKLLLRA